MNHVGTKKGYRELSRRDFIKAAGVTAAGIAASSLITDTGFAAASPKVIGANDRINIGFIGVGGMGSGHLHGVKKREAEWNVTCAAVCDVFSQRRDKAREIAGCPESSVYDDYRKLLEDKDIDAVLIATPDHWHGTIGVAALEAGKHIYIEKPMTRYFDEAVRLHKAAKESNRVVQVGPQGCSDAKWHTAGKIVKDGKIGQVLWAQGSYCRNNPHGEWNYPISPNASEQTIDWKTWLGPAPEIPFSAERYHRWRKYWDYGTGIIGDLWPHRLHPLMIAIATTDFPARVTCLGANICNTDEGYGDPRDVADTTMMTAEFPGGFMIHLAGSTVNEQGLADVIRGHKATLYFGGRKVQIRPERPYVDEIDSEDVDIVGPGESQDVHRKNWIDSIRGEAEPACGIDLGLRVQAMVSMAEMSYRQSKMMKFDPNAMSIS